jgi:WD40 repeat protein
MDKTIKVWNVSSSECMHTLRGHSDDVPAMVFTKDGQFIISGSRDKTIRVWSVYTGACVNIFQGHGGSYFIDRCRSAAC